MRLHPALDYEYHFSGPAYAMFCVWPPPGHTSLHHSLNTIRSVTAEVASDRMQVRVQLAHQHLSAMKELMSEIRREE